MYIWYCGKCVFDDEDDDADDDDDKLRGTVPS